jgi:hypothetical protein
MRKRERGREEERQRESCMRRAMQCCKSAPEYFDALCALKQECVAQSNNDVSQHET